LVRLNDLSKEEQEFHKSVPCPVFNETPWVKAKTLKDSKIAIISTAGIHQSGDMPFMGKEGDYYRILPNDIATDDIVMSHVSVNFDRSGFHQDINVVFPIDRLKELHSQGEVGSLASYHYSFMGADDPVKWKDAAKKVAQFLKADNVDAVFLVPV